MKLSDFFRVLSGKKKRSGRRRIRQAPAAHGPIELLTTPVDLDFSVPPERPPMPARVIDVQGTFGRNAVDPPRKRRR